MKLTRDHLRKERYHILIFIAYILLYDMVLADLAINTANIININN
jgi:hypothetical protein